MDLRAPSGGGRDRLTRERRVVEACAETLGSIRLDAGADGALDDVLRALKQCFRAELMCAMCPERGPRGWSLGAARFDGFPAGRDPARQMARLLDDVAKLGPPAFDALDPSVCLPNRAVRPLVALTGAARDGARRLLRALGAADRDLLRVVACEESTLLAWIGLLRRQEFTESEERELEQLVPALVRHLSLARRVRDAELTEATLAVTLEALGDPALIVRPDGRVVAANQVAQALTRAPAAFRAELDGALGRNGAPDASPWLATPIGDATSPSGYLVTRRDRGSLTTRIAVASCRWGLSSAEARVLAELAGGATNERIAARLGSSKRTVEIHVSSILRKSGLASRFAVVAELSRSGWFPPQVVRQT
jgi:DNA-binding CsgD family transcriptional regulator